MVQNLETDQKDHGLKEESESIKKMNEILRKQNDTNFLRPVGSRKYKDWRDVPPSGIKWISKNTG